MDLQLSVVRYDQLSQETLLAADAIILSPGPGLPNEKAGLSALMDQFVGRTPILGVCLGMQALVEHLGGSLMNQAQVKHGVQETIDIMDHTGLFQGLPKRIEVGLYHSWKVVCPENWLTAHTEAGVPMALERPEMKVYGVQFHPESVLTPLGKEILRNFIQIVQHA